MSSSFTSPLWVTPLADGKSWRLIRPFKYHIGSKKSRRYISVPRNFVTDFASVPRMFFFLPDWATYSKAPVLHDWLYHQKTIMGKPITRQEADKIFLEAMKVDWRNHKFLHPFIARLEWLAVRLFGFWIWHRKRIK